MGRYTTDLTFRRITPEESRIYQDGAIVGEVYRQEDILNRGRHHYVTREAAAMFLAADDVGMTQWARGFAMGVRIVETAWPTDWFVADERRIVSLLARLAEGELSDLEACADVLAFIQWRWQARYGGGA